MALYKIKNFSRSKINNFTFQNGDEFEGCNFSQSNPNTEILQGLTGLKFTKCNLVNCSIPVDAIKDDCLHFNKSLCTNIHTNRIGEITPHEDDLLIDPNFTKCPENCAHVKSTDTFSINGLLMDTIYYYVDKVVL